jgi:hypothetical protein
MTHVSATLCVFALSLLGVSLAVARREPPQDPKSPHSLDELVRQSAVTLEEGRRIFRGDTFGDEDFWGGELRLHEAIAGSGLGGVGPGLSPKAALELGLVVDAESLQPEVLTALRQGALNLDDPANTLALLESNAVVGVKGFFDSSNQLSSVGITCALCHSTVDHFVAPGIGRRLDGWANRALDVGSIVALAPDLSFFSNHLGLPQDDVRRVLRSWGPGKYDAELSNDGKAFQPNGTSAATLIPPAFGLAGVNLHTWTGWGSVTHWNAYVANTQMHGKGTFRDARLDNALQFPLAAAAGLGHLRAEPDLISPKLPALHFYQLALEAPTPPAGSFNPQAAERGKELFEGEARCANCHVPPTFSEPGWNMHTPEEIGIDSFQADRSPDRRYRTAPLRGLWTHQVGGFYHDGRFATLEEVVDHYDATFGLGLNPADKSDLVQYLLSL